MKTYQAWLGILIVLILIGMVISLYVVTHYHGGPTP
jgi:hypothetical protein